MENIRKADKSDINLLVKIIRQSNIPVAKELHLTIENCPKHPSNCNTGWIADSMGKGEIFFIFEVNKTPVGCIAYESAAQNIAYVNRLAVLPEYQKKGIGQKLMKYHEIYSKSQNKNKIGIGVINKNLKLREWYKKLDYTEKTVKKFKHLPFDVCFMEKEL